MLKTRKSIGMGKGSGSDDDFKPIKPAALKRKPTEKKAAPQKSKDKDVIVRAAESSMPKRKTAQKIVVDEDEDEDMYIEAPPPKTKPDVRKKAPAPPSDRDSDEDVKTSPLPAKAKPVVGKKALAPASDPDSDVEVIETAQPKRKAAAATKPVLIESADSEEIKPSKGKGKAKVSPKRKR